MTIEQQERIGLLRKSLEGLDAKVEPAGDHEFAVTVTVKIPVDMVRDTYRNVRGTVSWVLANEFDRG
jgi:hypothetical protein